MFSQIIGHKNAREFLERSLANGRVAHAYLFSGPSKVGKMAVARAFAEYLLHTKSLEAHPDVIFTGRLSDEKTGLPKSNISIEQIREVRERLTQSSLIPGWKIAIIEDADAMGIEAANALLKTLEEPRGQTLIILIARDIRYIPQTIRSRAQLVRFGLASQKEIETGLVSRGAAREKAIEISELVHGRSGVAVDLLEDKNALKELKEEIDERQELLSKPDYERMLWIEKRAKGLKSAALEDEFRLWRQILRDQLLLYPTRYTLHPLKRLAESEIATRHHVDARLALEHFLLVHST